jgi:hypothetical protein
MRRKIRKETWEQVKTAYASGVGLREIARNLNIPEGTVLARGKREGWTRQIQNAKALAKRDDTSLVVTPTAAVAMSMQQRGELHVERMAGVSEHGVDHIETIDGPEILNSVDQIDKLNKVARRTFGLKDDNPYEGFTLNLLNVAECDIQIGKQSADQAPGVSRSSSGPSIRTNLLASVERPRHKVSAVLKIADCNQMQSTGAITARFFRQNSPL